tara:strand:- start:95 stop:1243 length:1149 start_codon:yes stop_codon:yes gene_type:complete
LKATSKPHRSALDAALSATSATKVLGEATLGWAHQVNNFRTAAWALNQGATATMLRELNGIRDANRAIADYNRTYSLTAQLFQRGHNSGVHESLYGAHGAITKLMEPFSRIEGLAQSLASQNTRSWTSSASLASFSTSSLLEKLNRPKGEISVATAMREAAEAFARLQPTYASIGLVEAARRSANRLEGLNSFQDRAFEIADEIDNQSDAEALGRLDLLVIQLGEYVQEVAMSSPSPAERMGILNILLALVSVLSLVIAGMTYQSQSESFELAQDQLAAQEETASAASETADILRRLELRMSEILVFAEATSSPYTQVLVVSRSMPLYAEPAMSSDVSGLALRGTLVDVIIRDKKWVLIRAFDQMSGQTSEGWIRKKYLRRP